MEVDFGRRRNFGFQFGKKISANIFIPEPPKRWLAAFLAVSVAQKLAKAVFVEAYGGRS